MVERLKRLTSWQYRECGPELNWEWESGGALVRVDRRPFLLRRALRFRYRLPAAECATWAALIPSKARPYPIPSSMIRLSF
jgi:hypothetical protein